MDKEKFEYTYDGVFTQLKRNKITLTIGVIVALTGGLAFFLSSINTVKENITKLNVYSPKAISGIATAISHRAYFYSEADVSTKRRSYVVSGQDVEYSKTKDGFIFASFTNKDGVKTQGWMLTSDFEFQKTK